jgi:hypothetical protein
VSDTSRSCSSTAPAQHGSCDVGECEFLSQAATGTHPFDGVVPLSVRRTPLSTTQSTRRAEAYGAVVMTAVIRSAKGSIPLLGAVAPITRARCTSSTVK